MPDRRYRRLRRAVAAASGCAAAVLLALAIASAGAMSLVGCLLILALGLGLYARHWDSLADRSSVGARSEDEVQRALASLESEGWRLRHSLRWRGSGDIDSVAIAPTGMAVVIETKTSTYEEPHLVRVRKQTAWSSADGAGGVAMGQLRFCASCELAVSSALNGRCSSSRSMS
jgi:hypothetical protein